MRVIVRTIGTLQALLGSGELAVDLEADCRVADLLGALGDAHGEALRLRLTGVDSPAVPPAIRVLVNGRDIGALDGEDTLLHDADDVLILTPVAGG
jgi:molybdopterin converting factor small subunit